MSYLKKFFWFDIIILLLLEMLFEIEIIIYHLLVSSEVLLTAIM
jgi:hypothetical protein